VGTVTVPGGSDSDPSHYCNPPEPEIEFQKCTLQIGPDPNSARPSARQLDCADFGADADDPNGPDVPSIPAGALIQWTYLVENTGTVAVPASDISVTDDALLEQSLDPPVFDTGDDNVRAGAESQRHAAQRRHHGPGV
jgi:hypothetical protein